MNNETYTRFCVMPYASIYISIFAIAVAMSTSELMLRSRVDIFTGTEILPFLHFTNICEQKIKSAFTLATLHSSKKPLRA